MPPPDASAISKEPLAVDPVVQGADEPDCGLGEKPLPELAAGPRSRLLHGPIGSAVFWLALPVLGEQALNALVTWNDAYLAGRITAEATGAVGIAGYISWLVTMLFWMVDTGATAIVSRAIGSGNPAEARRTTNQALVMALLMGLAATVLVVCSAPGFAWLLNMRGEAAGIATTFMRIDALGYLGAAVSFALAACLRGAGDTRTPLMVLGGVNVINVLATWGLTLGVGPIPPQGVAGIAWGTVIARWAGGIWVLVLMRQGRKVRERTPAPAGVREGALATAAPLKRRDAQPHAADSGSTASAREVLRLSLRDMRPDRALIWRMLRIGLPAAADGALTFAGHFTFMTIVTRVPSAFAPAVLYAAHIIGIRIESLSYLPANAWHVAAATMVGQNLGAGQPGRAKRAANAAARQAAVLLAATGGLYFFAAESLFRFLSNDPQVWRCGVPALKGLALVQIPLAFLIVYLGALRGAGDTRGPMKINALGIGLIRIPIGLFGGFVLKWGLLGAWLGMFVDLSVRSVLMGIRFGRGRWAKLKV